MNEFLGQFLIESRELVEQATDGLLVLERTPHDAEKLDYVFRAFHTLKGGAGIVEFARMERAVHAAEEILSAARAGKQPLTTQRVGECLTCLDQVVQWLDEMERTGEFPADGGEAKADANIDDHWIAQILHSHPEAGARAATALRFRPDPESFYRGEDPLDRVVSLPGLIALEFQPAIAWPTLNELDPYRCNLVFTALTTAAGSDVEAHLQGHSGTCEISALAAVRAAATDASLPPQARELLEAQLALLARATAPNFRGHVASAGVAAGNVLRSRANVGAAAAIAQATETSLRENSADALRDCLTRLLASERAVPAASAIPAAPAAPSPAPDSPSLAGRTESAARTLRIDAARIDALVRLTGELTVAKNAAGHVAKRAQQEGNSLAAALKERHGVLDRLVAELQTSVLGMRVLPLRSVLQRFPRVVREMSVNLGKPVELVIEGDETEADKTIVEMLFEPLLHVVRNAVDHGIETPGERAARGKPATAQIRIRASRQGDQVLLEIGDDGGGVDVARVREVARIRGVATEEQLAAMSEADVTDLVFAAGFSTAAKVSELSGRGVGMDAVRSAVERVGGRVALDSRAGHGTTVRFSLPFSVMMTHVMTVEAGGQMFGVPLDAIVETVSMPKTAIAAIGAAHAIVLRDRTIPVFDLANILGLNHGTHDSRDATLVVTALAGHAGAFQVDRIGERLEVILKPLDGLLAGMPGISGTTLLGDGRVLLVLDIGELL